VRKNIATESMPVTNQMEEERVKKGQTVVRKKA
jgi:hypothetical protein